MSVSGIGAVQARIDAIESRFGGRDCVGGNLGVVASPELARLHGSPTVAGTAPGTTATTATTATTFSDVLDRIDTPNGTDAIKTSGGDVIGSTAPMRRSGGLDGPVPVGTPFATNYEAEGASHGVPPRLLAAVGWVESRYTVDAVSPDGAIGVMQIMPMTADWLGVDPWDPDQAIDGAARLLADHYERFGSWDLALAAYHSGAGAVSRAGDTAPPRAAEYVRRVTERLETM